MGGWRMPLSEAERELISREAGRNPLPKVHWTGWTDALYRLSLKRRQIAGWVAIGLILSSYVGYRYPKYESTVQIMPPDSGGGSSGLAAILPALTKSPGLAGLAGDFLGSKSSSAVLIKVMQSRTVCKELMDQFHLQEIWKLDYEEDTCLKLGKRTDIADDKKSGVITLTVHDRNKDLAQNLATAYVVKLNEAMTRVSNTAAGHEREFIEKRLADEKEKLEQSEQQFSQFASSNMALDVPEQTKVTVEAAARLQGELIAARAQLEALKQTYTPENIRVKSAQAHVNELERELGRINSGRSSTATTQDASNPYPSVKNLPILGTRWADLYRENKIHETVVELLTQQYELARIQEAKDTPTAKILDEASTPERRRPNGILIAVAGTLLFALLACVGYLLKDWWDRWDRDDPRRVFLSYVLNPWRIFFRRGVFTRRMAKNDEMS
jgi:capsule polysaccharide export protein KpsE/RkpR